MNNTLKFAPPTQLKTHNTVWAVGGGKGGIGKSFVSSNLAICLSRLGKHVTLVDLDLGGANLHTCLGSKIPRETLSDFISGRAQNLENLAVETEVAGLKLISGSNDDFDVADIDKAKVDRLIDSIRAIRTPYVILDLGAGTSESTLDFFLASDQKIVAVTPEPTSIENAYRFLKSAYYRQLRTAERELGVERMLKEAMDARSSNGIRSPADLLRHISKENPDTGSMLMERVTSFKPQLLLNQVRTRNDIDLGHSMISVCRKYFGIEAGYLGYIDHDNAVWQSLRKRRPLIIEFPYSGIVGQFLGITKNLLNPYSLRAVV